MVRPLKNSVFLITLNTNKDLERHEAAKRDFREKVEHLMEDVYYYLKALDEEDYERGMEEFMVPRAVLIRRLRYQIAYETGEKYHRYHAHVLLKVKHETKLHVKREAIGHDLSAFLGYTVIVNVKGRADVAADEEDYIAKEVQNKAIVNREARIPSQ